MTEMSIEQLKAIKESLLREAACLTWSEIKQAFLHLYKFYDTAQKQLQEANQALQDAVADDIDKNQLI